MDERELLGIIKQQEGQIESLNEKLLTANMRLENALVYIGICNERESERYDRVKKEKL